jgi:lipopolysaccharide/colanic/teichoic acid biosynthesis glycosyltransferase
VTPYHRNVQLGVRKCGNGPKGPPVQYTMKYRSILAWVDYGNRQSGVQPPASEVERRSLRGPDGSPDAHRPAKARRLQRAAKRALDIVFATIGLILFSPLLLLASLALVLDSGWPVVRRQVRYGYGSQPLRVLQFRCTAADNGNEDVCAANECVTRIGRLLRSSGIDGLPRLFNVLRGEMSIVGPHLYSMPPGVFFEDLVLRISGQHDVKPGLIGWAQVNGCGNGSNSFRVIRPPIEYDLYYAENWSFLLDMKIILMALTSKKTYALTE